MKLGVIIREKRKEQSLTQEQLANLLGVSATAVHKWEKGTTYPDITTLPALARVLKTDLNTLLSFQEDLTDEEIARFVGALKDMVEAQGYDAAFQKAMEQIHQYPNCEKLIYSLVFYLDGARAIYDIPDPDDYPTCRDVLVKCIKFVVPEDLDVSGGMENAMCNERKFKVRFIAHNIDTDYRCCESVLTL